MADVPQAITVNGDTYTVPGADTIEPLAASVSYDGSGAGGSFMPCLSIYSQSGHLISRTFPQLPVAAGASAEVSFIPFVPPASGSGGGATIVTDTVEVFSGFGQDTSGYTPSTWLPFVSPSGPTVTIPVSGQYLVRFGASITYYTNRTYEYQIGVSLNGAEPVDVRLPFIMDYPGSYAPSGASGTVKTYSSIELGETYAAGDVLALWTWHDAGGAAWPIRTLTATLIG